MQIPSCPQLGKKKKKKKPTLESKSFKIIIIIMMIIIIIGGIFFNQEITLSLNFLPILERKYFGGAHGENTCALPHFFFSSQLNIFQKVLSFFFLSIFPKIHFAKLTLSVLCNTKKQSAMSREMH